MTQRATKELQTPSEPLAVRERSLAVFQRKCPMTQRSTLRHSREITHLCSPDVTRSGRRSARRFGKPRHAAFAADDNVTQLATGNMTLRRLRRG